MTPLAKRQLAQALHPPWRTARGAEKTQILTAFVKATGDHRRYPWDERLPGFTELDLVAHCGESTRGEDVHSLSVVDIATVWFEPRTLATRSQRRVFEALTTIRDRLPFPLLGIDADNDSPHQHKPPRLLPRPSTPPSPAPGSRASTTRPTWNGAMGQ